MVQFPAPTPPRSPAPDLSRRFSWHSVMRSESLTDGDRALIEAAEALLWERFVPDRHRCAAAVRAESGTVYTGINLLPELGVAGVHAEPIAVGQAVAEGETAIDTSVAVVYEDDDPSGDTAVVAACGVCRELLYGFAPQARILVSNEDGLRKVPVADLLPCKS